MTDSERTEWAAIVEWARHVEASPDDLVPSVISIIDAPVALAVDDELNRLRAENANLSRSLAAVTQGLNGTGKVLAETLAERDRVVAERDALIDSQIREIDVSDFYELPGNVAFEVKRFMPNAPFWGTKDQARAYVRRTAGIETNGDTP